MQPISRLRLNSHWGFDVELHSWEDISNNYCWLKSWCETFPDRIPSGFFMMDTFLMLDFFMDRKLLLNETHQTKKNTTYEQKIDFAREESGRLKKLLGALRYLWRNGHFELYRYNFHFW